MAPRQQGIPPREDPVRLRDAALHRISLTRRWMIVAAAGLTAGFAALVSAILPGKSLGAKSPTAATVSSTRSASSATPPLPSPATAAQLGLGSAGGDGQQSVAPPPSAPQPAPSQSAPAQSAPAQSAPAPAPAPAPSSAVSGGS